MTVHTQNPSGVVSQDGFKEINTSKCGIEKISTNIVAQNGAVAQPDTMAAFKALPGCSPILGKLALEAFLGTLRPKGKDSLPQVNSRELWLKYGHDKFLKGRWDEKNNLVFFCTKLNVQGDSASRVTIGTRLLFPWLARKCREQDGGAFYIPTQPHGLPVAANVTCTDTLSVEIDQGTALEQWTLYQEFRRVTGLIWSSLLTSGGKSIHGHIKADQHLPLDQAQYLRRLIVIAMQSDPVTVRLHQPMRIPGF